MGKTVMNEKYSAYPEYKDSGVEWSGLIPESWSVIRHKYIATFQKGKNPEILLDEFEEGAKRYLSMDYLRGNAASLYAYPVKNSYVSKKNQVLIIWDGSNAGEFVIAQEGIVSSTMAASEFLASINQRYYWYLCICLEPEMRKYANGMGIPHVDGNELKNSFLTIPSDREAGKIANFLDHETAKIDTLIEKQQQLIKLLKEKRQAVISHAVTKGISSINGADVPMKKSGVEWLGDVPEHWDVSQVGHCAFVTKLTGFEYTSLWKIDEGGAVIALRGFNVKERKLELNDVENISLELSTTLVRSKLAKGDIVFPCTGTIGNAAMIEENDKFHINQNIAKIRFDESVSSRFAIYWLTSSFIRTLIDKNNTSGMQPVVLIGDIRKLPIPRFKYEEQEAVADYLDSVADRFNILISNAISAIYLMRERRTALISAAVTGKIDVRNWSAD